MLANKGKDGASPDAIVALGLDIGGTRIKAIAFHRPDVVVDEFDVPSRANESPAAVR